MFLAHGSQQSRDALEKKQLASSSRQRSNLAIWLLVAAELVFFTFIFSFV
jgi:hypothetical protein